MWSDDLQSLCELGQHQLMEMDYLRAEATLARAEQRAWQFQDFDTLARLYMPLQETRRQRRQRCGEGIVRLDLLATGEADALNPEQLIDQIPHGQLLIAGWGSIAPALRFRELQSQRALYVETFLAAVYPIVGGSRAVVIVPREGVELPPPRQQSIDALLHQLTSQCLVMNENELPRGPRQGTHQTYGQIMALWERLHAPFLAAAEMQVDPLRRIEHYRHTICVDYACELAHQKLADVAKDLARQARQQSV